VFEGRGIFYGAGGPAFFGGVVGDVAWFAGVFAVGGGGLRCQSRTRNVFVGAPKMVVVVLGFLCFLRSVFLRLLFRFSGRSWASVVAWA